MKVLDYIFYRISDAYIRKWKDKQGYIHGGGIITFIEIMNIGSLFLIIGILSSQFYQLYFEPLKEHDFLHSWTTIPVLLLFVFNALFFNKKRYNNLVDVWADEDKYLRKKRGWLIVGYIVLSLFMTMFLGIYLNHHS